MHLAPSKSSGTELDCSPAFSLTDFQRWLTSRGLTTDEAIAICSDEECDSYAELWAAYERSCQAEPAVHEAIVDVEDCAWPRRVYRCDVTPTETERR